MISSYRKISQNKEFEFSDVTKWYGMSNTLMQETDFFSSVCSTNEIENKVKKKSQADPSEK